MGASVLVVLVAMSALGLLHLVVGGVLLLLIVAWGLIRRGRVGLYAIGAACLFAALFLGSVSGPLFVASATGYCDSVFEPFEPGHRIDEDAPPGTALACESVRSERIPIICVLGLAGVALLGRATVKRTPSEPAHHAA